MNAPISVIIPCYRCAKTIERAITSVMQQSLLPKEVLLIEDASDDNGETMKLLNRLQQVCQDKVDVKVTQLTKNGGPAVARNVGWDIAQQPFIAFLDADDAWHPRKLEIQYQWMEAHSEVPLTGHRSVQIRSGEQAPNLPNQVKASLIGRHQLLMSNCLPTRSAMLRREISFRFEPAKRYAEDYLLWLSIVLGGRAAWILDAPLAYSYKADFGIAGLSEIGRAHV